MTRDQLIFRLEEMVRRGKITVAEAGRILSRFDRGLLPDIELSLPSAAPILTTGAAAAALSGSAAMRVLREVISGSNRINLSQAVEEEFEEAVSRIVSDYTKGRMSLSRMHERLLEEITADLLRQAQLGTGGILLPSELARIRPIAVRQAVFLSRFMDEVAFRQLAGRPFSEKYIRRRANMYAGENRRAFYQFAEEAYDVSTDVVDYISMDDPWVCEQCRRAEREGPYLPGQGPMPKAICLGRDRCRCRRERRYAPELAQALRRAA